MTCGLAYREKTIKCCLSLLEWTFIAPGIDGYTLMMRGFANGSITPNVTIRIPQDSSHSSRCDTSNSSTRYAQMAFDILTATVIFCLNIVTIIVLWRSKAVRRTTSFFLLNLCITDIAVSVSVPICIAYDYFIYKLWPSFGVLFFLCSFVQFSAIMASACGFLLVAIERFICVVYPLQYKTLLTTRRIRVALVIKWLYILTVKSIPMPFFVSAWYNNTKAPCFQHILLPPVLYETTYASNTIIPVVVTSLLYCRIFLEAHKQRQRIVKMNHLPSSHIKRDYKVTIMLTMLIGAFLFCYVPFIVTSQLRLWLPLTRLPSWFCSLNGWFYTLMLCNSFMNSLIYFWRSKSFRNSLKQLLGCQKKKHLFRSKVDEQEVPVELLEMKFTTSLEATTSITKIT